MPDDQSMPAADAEEAESALLPDAPIYSRPVVPREQISYAEKYRGTAWAQPAPPPVPRTRRYLATRPSFTRIVTVISGTSFLLTGILGLCVGITIFFTGSVARIRLPEDYRLLLPTSMPLNIAYILLGGKIIFSPGFRSLITTGVMYALSAGVVILAILGNSEVTPLGWVSIALMVLWGGAIGVGSIWAAVTLPAD